MKLPKIFPLFLFGVALSVCTLSCGDGGDSEDSATKTTTEKTPENPTVNSENTVAATSLEGAINAETLKKDDDDGIIKITMPSGEFFIYYDDWYWEFWNFESGATNGYIGFFTGDATKLGTEEVALKLTVTGVCKNGKLYPVSEKKEFDFVATPPSFSMEIPEVKLKDLSNIKEPEVTLPESVGENPFSGKAFKGNEWEWDGSSGKRTWTFSDSIATEIYESYKNGILFESGETEYRYTYDASQNLLYLALKAETYDDYIDGKKVREITHNGFIDYMLLILANGADEDFAYADAYSLYSVPYCMQYEINEDKIKLERYFDGTLPTQTGFSYHNNNYKPSISIGDGAADLKFRYDGKRFVDCPKPTYSDGNISGKVYKDYKLLGEIEGTYTTSGTGTSDCSVTLTFTKLPSELTEAGFEIGKEYTLTYAR
ncbi:MAG: hypothetical protein K6B43_13255 [Treponema sp.]|nr:hypothetical protein [Treponema sp.]